MYEVTKTSEGLNLHVPLIDPNRSIHMISKMGKKKANCTFRFK